MLHQFWPLMKLGGMLPVTHIGPGVCFTYLLHDVFHLALILFVA